MASPAVITRFQPRIPSGMGSSGFDGAVSGSGAPRAGTPGLGAKILQLLFGTSAAPIALSRTAGGISLGDANLLITAQPGDTRDALIQKFALTPDEARLLPDSLAPGQSVRIPGWAKARSGSTPARAYPAEVAQVGTGLDRAGFQLGSFTGEGTPSGATRTFWFRRGRGQEVGVLMGRDVRGGLQFQGLVTAPGTGAKPGKISAAELSAMGLDL